MRRGLLLIAMALLMAMPASPLVAEPAEDAQKAANEVIRRLDIQRELPVEPEENRPSSFNFHVEIPPGVLWLIVICGILFLAYHFRDVVPAWRLRRDSDGPGILADGSEIHSQPAAPLMMAADELARQGRFVEAMHILLLQGLADIRLRLDEPFADSLTSREILRSGKLSDRIRIALREIIARVEWTYFGEHPAERADYDACRDRYNELSLALGSEAGA